MIARYKRLSEITSFHVQPARTNFATETSTVRKFSILRDTTKIDLRNRVHNTCNRFRGLTHELVYTVKPSMAHNTETLLEVISEEPKYSALHMQILHFARHDKDRPQEPSTLFT